MSRKGIFVTVIVFLVIVSVNLFLQRNHMWNREASCVVLATERISVDIRENQALIKTLAPNVTERLHSPVYSYNKKSDHCVYVHETIRSLRGEVGDMRDYVIYDLFSNKVLVSALMNSNDNDFYQNDAAYNREKDIFLGSKK